jgi:NodT family efflux transporter outer membrane factor (OMF) lipoprotein
VGPHYHPPKVSTPPAFGELNSRVTPNEPVADWWKEFHDAELSRLISAALRSNYDIQIAAVRIRASRNQRNIAAADLWPQLNGDGSYIHSRGSKNVVLPLGGVTQGNGSSSGGTASGASRTRTDAPSAAQGNANVSPSAPSIAPSPFGQGGLPGATTDLYQVGFDASWEIDVFGGKRRLVEAASAELASVSESEHAMQVSIAAEVARDYMELRGAQERLRIARENLASQTDVLQVTQSKSKVGLATDLDSIRAAAQVDATSATLSPLEADVRRLVHALSVLVGKSPNELSAELSDYRALPAIPLEVPVGLPSELLKRRADIRQAEREIAAATARIGNAQADLFPKFALIANAGLDSSTPGNLINWSSRYFLISPTVAWRIFDAGRILSNIRLQEANAQEASLEYQNTILKALREVEDALVAYASEHVRQNHLLDELKQDQQALILARQRYDKGLADFLDVLDAERAVFAAQDSVAQSTVSISTDLVALYKALGGGWH